MMLSLTRIIFLISLICHGFISQAQQDSAKAFNGKEEIVYDGKRYRVYNNWLSVGGGAGYNTKWPTDQKNLAADFSFHVKQYYFRLGAFMSGRDFTASNTNSFHLGIGLRKEHEKYNLSAFVGPSYSNFRRPLKDSLNYDLTKVYSEAGLYGCIEAVYKIKYDVGVGGQIFCDYNNSQMVYGVRLIVYFSGAYRGIKYGYQKPKKQP